VCVVAKRSNQLVSKCLLFSSFGVLVGFFVVL
jgi:hypothetical protein